MTSELTQSLGDTLAAALNQLDPTVHASAARMGQSEMLARIHNVLSSGADVSYKTHSVNQILAGIYNAVAGGPTLSHRTSSRLDLLAAIRNALTTDPDLSPSRTSEGALWYAAMVLVGAAADDGVTLRDLYLSANTIAENSAADTVVGTVSNTRAGSTLSLTGTASGRFKLVSGVIKADSVATDYETATSHSITVRETFVGHPGSPKDTVLTILVTDVAEGGSFNAGYYVPALAL